MNDEKALPPVLTMDAPERTLDVVTLEIQTLQRQAIEVNLLYAIEIGRRLTEAKAMLPHGQWGDYLKTQVSYSQSTANNLMRIFREYGDNQQSLFGAAKSQTFANLPYSKALRLLAIPDEEEREQFAADHDLDAMSVRELDAAIKARDEAQREAAAAQKEAVRLREETAAAQQKAERLRKDAQTAEEERQRASNMAQRLQSALSDANANAQTAAAEQERLQRELEELRNRPVEVAVEADQEAIENARKAAIAEMTGKLETAKSAKKTADQKRKAAEDALAAAQKELEALKARTPEVRELSPEEKEAIAAAEVEKARAEGAERIRSLEKQLASADPNVAEFKVRFASWHDEYWKMVEVLKRIAQTDDERAARLWLAVKAEQEQMENAKTSVLPVR